MDGQVKEMSYLDYGPGLSGLELRLATQSESESEKSRMEREAVATINRANRDIERAEKRLAAIEAFGDDDYEDETVLLFYKKFVNSGRKYTYCALKVAGYWFLTGPQQSGLKYNWGALIDFVVKSADEEYEVWQVSNWVRVV